MKKNLLNGLVLLFSLVMLTACPYSSSVPITEANLPAGAAHLGKWYDQGDLKREKEFPKFYEFTHGDEDDSKHKYLVIENTYNTTDKIYKKKRYYAHFSKIKNQLFLNMKPENESKYYLYKFDEASETEFTLFEITDNIDEKFSSSEELSAFVEKNMELSFFYNKSEKTYKKK